jgi:uncharacterized protein
MSQENVEIVRLLYDAIGQGDTATALSLYSPEVVWDVSEGPIAALEGAGVYRGHAGLQGFFRRFRDAWEHVEFSLSELTDAGDHVVSVGTQVGRGRASGLQITGANYAVWTLQDGVITRVRWFGSLDQAMDAAELGEKSPLPKNP